MAEETVDEEQASTPDDAVEQETEQESDPSEEELDVEVLKANLAKAEKVARDQKGRADKAEIQLKKAKKEPQATESNDSNISREEYERLNLKTDGYSNEEVETIMELGGTKVLSNPVVKQAVAELRRKAKSTEATPTGTAKSPVFKKFSEQELKRMPLAELEKIVPQE